MADWYVSSAAWTAIPQFAASHAYSIGDIVRPLTAPAFGAQFAFRCTTAGTSSTEPTWPPANNATVGTGGAIFTNVTGQSTYGWSAAAGNIFTMSFNGIGFRFAVGDRCFVSSDSSESGTANQTYVLSAAGATFGSISVISVNRAGSVPPVAADVLSGASIIFTGVATWFLDAQSNEYWQGVTFTLGGSATNVCFNNSGTREHYFKNCSFVFTTSNTSAYLASNDPAKIVFDNTTVTFNAVGQGFGIPIGGYAQDLSWINTPSAVLGSVPTILFKNPTSYAPAIVTCRGVDLSAVNTTLVGANGSGAFQKLLFDSCRINSSVVRLATAGTFTNSADEVELVNCYDGSNFLSERHTPAGDLTTEFTITLSGGAVDNVGAFSHKMVSSSRSDKFAMFLESFWMDVNNSTIGGSRTATVEIISSASLNNDDITLLIEYEGTLGSSLASFVTSFPNPLTTVAAIATSTATWNSSPATPVKQHLQVTFTPLVVGRVRGQVRLGKPSTTVYVNPQLVLT